MEDSCVVFIILMEHILCGVGMSIIQQLIKRRFIVLKIHCWHK